LVSISPLSNPPGVFTVVVDYSVVTVVCDEGQNWENTLLWAEVFRVTLQCFTTEFVSPDFHNRSLPVIRNIGVKQRNNLLGQGVG